MNLLRFARPLAAAAIAGISLFASMAEAQTTRVRLMAANISSGNNQGYDAGHGTRIFQGTDPDIVMIQEFNYGDNSQTTLQNWVTSTFGAGFTFYREGGAQIPNGIISRYPIKASGEWDDVSVTNRDFAWARIDVPGNKDLWAISVHFLTTSASLRNTEATNLRTFIQNNVPAGDFVVIGGDYNTSTRSEACFSTLSSIVSTASPYPADKNGNTNTNASRAKPYDHVLVSSNLRTYQTSTIIGSSTFANGLVLDTRVYTPISEIAPALTADSGSTNMQHMAIIKDFLLPTSGTATPTPTPTATATATPTPTPTATATATATPTPTPISGALTSGVQVSGSVAAAGWVHYYIDVPAGATQLAIVQAGSSGDADLHVRYNAQPTASLYDYRPYASGSNETVTVTGSSTPRALTAGRWYISVNGYSAASYTLRATVTSGSTPTATATPTPTPTVTPTPTPTPTATPGGSTTLVNVTNITVATGAWRNYPITVPAGATRLEIIMAGSTGDADMYVRKGTSFPTTTTYDYRPYLTGSNETLNITPSSTPVPLASGSWYVSVYGYSAGTFNLTIKSYN